MTGVEERLIDRILDDENIERAYKQVYANKGAGGVDGVTVYELKQNLNENWPNIREAILSRTYRPQPVQRVEIPKSNGGKRKLGIPTVVDRTIEQAMAQILTPIFEETFSNHSYGFRPGRSCEKAILRTLELMNDEFEWIVDIDLEKRELNFVRYADDCIITVKSEAAANRVMHTVTEFIEKKLGLKVNAEKTQVVRPSKLKYLGFGFFKNARKHRWEARPHEDSIAKFRAKLKKLCKRSWSVDMTYRIRKLNEVIRGWINYYAITSMKKNMIETDKHLRTMIRIVIWKQWKVPSKREWGLKKLGINKDLARQTAYCGNRYQFVALRTCVSRAISKEILTRRGLVSCVDYYAGRHATKTN